MYRFIFGFDKVIISEIEIVKVINTSIQNPGLTPKHDVFGVGVLLLTRIDVPALIFQARHAKPAQANSNLSFPTKLCNRRCVRGPLKTYFTSGLLGHTR